MAKNKGLGNPALMLAGSLDPTTKRILVIGGVALVGFAVYKYTGLVSGALEAFGLKDSKEDKEEAEAVEKGSKMKAFDPNYWRTAKSPYVIYDEASSKKLAEKIEDAWGTFNDDEEQVYGVFRGCRSQAHISRVADQYAALFNKGLYDDLKARLDESELAQVVKIVQDKPTLVKAQ